MLETHGIGQTPSLFERYLVLLKITSYLFDFFSTGHTAKAAEPISTHNGSKHAPR